MPRRAGAKPRYAFVRNFWGGSDLNRRLYRQLLNLESDDITAAARRQIATRMAELVTDLAQRQATARALQAELETLPPDLEETTDALTRLPQLAQQLPDLPQPALRRRYDALDLQISYQPGDRVADIGITLTDAIGTIAIIGDETNALAPSDDRAGPASQVCSVPPVGVEPTLSEV